jgi:molecular chaperone GrpE
MIDRPEDATLLAQFRQWLHRTRAEADEAALAIEGLPPAVDEGRAVGLYRLVEEFTALRHELKLQTKSTRGLQEQAEALLRALSQAIEQFRAVEPREAQAAQAAGRPLAEALADLDEALDRGRGEIEKARRRIVEDSAQALEAALAALDALHARRRWPWRRALRPYHEQVKEIVRREAPGLHRGLFDALLEGYGLIQSRLQRALAAEQIRRIACVGRPVDPDCMTVIEVVDEPDRPAGEVVEELRRGYTWKGRVLRFAEVRAVRTPAASGSAPLPSGDGEIWSPLPPGEG